MIEARNWLPQNAIFDGKVSKRVDQAVQSWAAKWLAHQSDIVSELSPQPKGASISIGDQIWESSERQLVMQLAEDNRLSLAELLIGKAIPSQKVSRADKDVLKKLVTASLDDLHSKLIDELDTEDEYDEFIIDKPEHGFENLDYVVEVKLKDDATVLQIWMTENLIAGVRKQLVSEQVEFGDLGSLAKAVSLQTVAIGARAGSSKLGINELKKLSQGDVIVLDRDLGAPMQLTLNNQMVSSMYCKVVHDTGEENLKLTQISAAQE